MTIEQLDGLLRRSNVVYEDDILAVIAEVRELRARVAELERLGDHLLNAIREHTEVYLDGGESLSHAEEAWRKVRG